MPDFRQPGFPGGEITPSLWGRTDSPHYAYGLRTCRNFLISPQGAAVSKPGSLLIGQTKVSGQPVRLVKFMVEAGTSFVLEFGNYYLRFIQSGAYVTSGGPIYELTTPYAATDLSRLKVVQSGDVMTIVHPSYPPMELVRLSSSPPSWTLTPFDFMAPGTPLRNNTTYLQANGVLGVSNASNYCSNDAPTYAAGTTYQAGQYVTYSGTVYISLGDGNTGNTPQSSGPTAWWAPAQDVSHTAKTWYVAFSVVYRDANGVVRETNAPRVFPLAANQTLTLAQDRPATWTVKFSWPAGWTGVTPIALNCYRGRSTLLGLVTTTPISGVAVGGSVYLAVQDDGSDPDYTSPPRTNGFPFQAGAVTQAAWLPAWPYLGGGEQAIWQGQVWKSTAAGAGHQPDLSPTYWSLNNYAAGTAYIQGDMINRPTGMWVCIQGCTGQTPESSPAYWQAIALNPSTVGYFEQRLVFGGTGALESALALSATGQRTNFDESTLATNPAAPLNPVKDSSSLLFYLASTERDQIRSLVGMRSLLVLTSLGEWSLRGASGNPLTSKSFDAKKHSRRGSDWLDPIVSGNVILYVTVQKSRIRDLVYNFYADSYSGKDVSQHAEHLLRGHSIVDWAYATVPYSVVWMVRDDGVLLSLTYQNAPLTDFEQDDKIAAWAHHDTQGTFENVCVIQEGTEDAVYLIANRFGQRYLERMATRLVTDVRQYVGSDCASIFSGANPIWNTVWQLSLSGAFTPGSTPTVTASGTGFTPFSSGQVGTQYVVIDPAGTLYPTTGYSAVPLWAAATSYAVDTVIQWKGSAYYSLQNGNVGHAPGNSDSTAWWSPANGPFYLPITSFSSSTSVNVSLPRGLPPAVRAVWTAAWGITGNSVFVQSGNFEGKTMAVLADGIPTTGVVSGGYVTLATPALYIVAGFGFTAELETLDLFSRQMELRSVHKAATKAGIDAEIVYSLKVTDTLDPVVGTPFVDWTPKVEGDQSYPGAPDAFTGFDHAFLRSAMSHAGRVAFRLAVPLPATITAITRDVELAGS